MARESQKYGRTWDDVPLPGVGVSDLDGRTLDEFRRRAAASGRLAGDILDESDSGVIEKLRLREGEYLKRAAVLLFHPEPGILVRDAYVKIGCFRGAELLFQDVIEGDLFTQVDRTMDLLYSKYSRGLVSYDGVYRVETFPVPRQAMREAVINAVIHRDYADPVPIQIRVYDDRIILWNPGHLPADWTVERLSHEHASRPYNPGIAYAFLRAGMIEARGRGIGRIASACEAAGNPRPEWKMEPGGGLWLEFRYSAAYQTADGVVRATGNGVPPESWPRRQPESQRDKTKLNLPEYRLLRAELNTLEDLINGLPAESILERTSLEYRMSQVEEELASLPDHPKESFQENIHEEERIIDGRFLGALPSQRVFEFLEDHTDKLISGRIDRSIGDVSQINEALNRPSRIRIISRRIGTANPRFVLLDHDCRDDLSF